jgi:hypothetical protein
LKYSTAIKEFNASPIAVRGDGSEAQVLSCVSQTICAADGVVGHGNALLSIVGQVHRRITMATKRTKKAAVRKQLKRKPLSAVKPLSVHNYPNGPCGQ